MLKSPKNITVEKKLDMEMELKNKRKLFQKNKNLREMLEKIHYSSLVGKFGNVSIRRMQIFIWILKDRNILIK